MSRHPTSLCAALAMCMACGASHAADSKCEGGWFASKAQIVRIEPAGAKAIRRAVNGRESDVGVDEVLCAGETLVVPTGTRVRNVEYYEAGRTERLQAGGTHVMGSAADVLSGQAAEFVRAAMGAVGSVSAPRPRPTATSTRGTGAADPGAMQPILSLRDAPRQRVALGSTVIPSWREGRAPYTCSVHDENGQAVWTGPPTEAGWCSALIDNPGAARLTVRDQARRSIGWNLQAVSWSDVPRPGWIDARATGPQLPPGLQGAWAIWLWTSAPAAWRLQAMGMLDASSRSEWIAGYFLDSVLNEVPPLAAKD